MTAWFEGALAAHVVVAGGYVVDVALRGARRMPSADMLRGKTADEAARLVPLLFAACGAAHGAAIARAVENAVGVTAECSVAREMLVLAEVLDAHAWAVLMDWAGAADGVPDAPSLRKVRVGTGLLRASLDPRGHALRPGGGDLRPDRTAIAASLATIADLAAAIGGDPPADAASFARWAEDARTPAARFTRLALADGRAGFGASDVPLQPPIDAAWFARRWTEEPELGAAPTVDGVPHEPGPLARSAAHPLVASVIAAHGKGLLARIAARLAEVSALPVRMRALASELGDVERREVPAGGGTGCAVTETSRGRLAHLIELREGRVVDWRCAAPTEWSFHPRGAFVRGLLGMPSAGLLRAARLHVQALDPCVPCSVELEEAA